MSRKEVGFSSVVWVLLVSTAVAQQGARANDSEKPQTESQSQLAKNLTTGATAVEPVKAANPALSENKPSDQPSTEPGMDNSAAPKDGALSHLPFVEEFPPDPSAAEVVRPHGALPVILNPNSPSLDRLVRREDIQTTPSDYVIGEEDILTISIWKEHDLTGTGVVRPDGKITVPLVGEIKVIGMRPAQLQTLLEEKLKPFITVPQVSVAVNQINSRKIYLIGQVVREGSVPINSSMTVLQVLAGAGGLRDFAKRKKIYILRKRGDQEIRFPFDYDAAIRGRNPEQNIRVEPGDTIVVP